MVLAVAALSFSTGLHLIPTPRSVRPQPGWFRLERHLPVKVVSRSEEDSYAAEQLIEESPTSFGWSRGGRQQASVIVGRIGRAVVDATLKRLGLSLPKEAGEEGYVLSVRPGGIVCAGKSAAGTFYAVQTLRQLVRANRNGDAIPSVDIVDWPAMRMRGWQDDVSRGPIPTLAFLKNEVRQLSHYKLNAFTLYTEHVFKLRRHPDIAPRDGLSAQEIAELDNYCKKLHVQLIGNFQSFGHFANILRLPAYRGMAETPDVVSPAREETYRFLGDVYSEVAPAYSSRFFDINCDESYGLGEGPAKEMVAKQGLGRVYAGHINRVAKLLAQYGKTPMMWGDIALQHPDIRSSLPKDLVVLTWGYDPRESFVDQIQPFSQMGFRYLVCPGVSCWGQIFPDLDAAVLNIAHFVRDGAANGAMGVLDTTWDDDGENLFNNNWHPLVWGAEMAWKPLPPQASSSLRPPVGGLADPELKQRLQTFNEAFPRLFFGLPDGSLSATLFQLSRLRGMPASEGLSNQAVWKPLWQLGPSEISAVPNSGFAQSSMDVLMAVQHARAQAKFNADALLATEVAAWKVSFLANRAKQAESLAGLLKAGDEAREFFGEELSSSLSGQLSAIAERYAKAWALEARPWWLDKNMAKAQSAAKAAGAIRVVPFMTPNGGVVTSPYQVTIKTLAKDADVRYRLDGSLPEAGAAAYTAPISLSESAVVTARARLGDAWGPAVTTTYSVPSRPCSIQTNWAPFDGHEAAYAFDGLPQTYFWSSGQPLKDSTFTVVFNEADLLPSVTVETGTPDHPQDIVHEGVLEVSPDGQKWREMAKFVNGTAHCGMVGFNVKALRVRMTKDNGNWLAIREILIR